MGNTAEGYRDGVALWAAATDKEKPQPQSEAPTAGHSFGSL